MTKDFEQFVDDFGWRLLAELGHDWLPADRNPITAALADGDFVERFGEMPGFSRIAVSKLATACQMVVYNRQGGPEKDERPKALRRHWYSWYKTEFAQPFARQLGDLKANAQGIMEMDDRLWAGRLSQTYAAFVDTGRVTYLDLWVEDASRMMQQFYSTLFNGCHIVIAVEKDSLFGDFVAPAQALGATTVYSGKGKSSKAAIEKVLREHFYWREGNQPFDNETPLVILHVSDYDYDGEKVIGPTFAAQAARYAGAIYEARVGIDPPDCVDAGVPIASRWYDVKVTNTGYVKWADEKALFAAECSECGAQFVKVGTDLSNCPKCDGLIFEMTVKTHTPHGLEVEALTTRNYYGLIVDALLRCLPFDYIVGKLRDECKANAGDAAGEIVETVLADNKSYQKLLGEFDRLEEIKGDFEAQVRGAFEDAGRDHVEDWRDDDDDPEAADFRHYVERADRNPYPWRPFKTSDRTDSLVEWLRENESETIADFSAEVIEWNNDATE